MTTSPLRLPDLAILSRRPVHYADPGRAQGLGLPPHVRSASSAVLIAGDLFVLQDDVNALARVDTASALAAPISLPLAGPLARDRDDKAGLGACSLLPGGRLLLMGSGSRPERRVALEFEPGSGQAHLLRAEPLYRALEDEIARLGGKLNLEGIAVAGGVTHFFHRAREQGPANVVLHAPTGEVVASLRHGRPLASPPKATGVDLGSLDGAALVWTDALEVYGVGLVFTAITAGATASAGGAALGVLTPGYQVAWARLVEPSGAPLAARVEGLAIAGERCWLVSKSGADMPSELIEVAFGDLHRGELIPPASRPAGGPTQGGASTSEAGGLTACHGQDHFCP